MNNDNYPQVVVCSANKYKGYIILGARHWDGWMVKQADLIDKLHPDIKEKDAEQGFVDNFGEFLTREEAYHIALKNNQIKHHVSSVKNMLFSENMY